MKLLAAFFRIILSPDSICLPVDVHARLIRDWIEKPSRNHLHPQCTWTLAQRHLQPGTNNGVDFYDWYIRQRAITYPEWDQVVTQVIGSQIGAIVVGTYQSQRNESERRSNIPFTQFYRIRQGKIVSVRYFIGTVSICSYTSRPLVDLFSALHLPSLN